MQYNPDPNSIRLERRGAVAVALPVPPTVRFFTAWQNRTHSFSRFVRRDRPVSFFENLSPSHPALVYEFLACTIGASSHEIQPPPANPLGARDWFPGQASIGPGSKQGSLLRLALQFPSTLGPNWSHSLCRVPSRRGWIVDTANHPTVPPSYLRTGSRLFWLLPSFVSGCFLVGDESSTNPIS